LKGIDEKVPMSVNVSVRTEGLVMEYVGRNVRRLRQLAERGVGVALDEFGVGHSSLSDLQQLPLTTLKIDRSLLTDIHSDQSSLLAASIIAMAKNLYLKVIAEAVETPEHVAFPRANGCATAQGYYSARPIPPEAVLKLLDYSMDGSITAMIRLCDGIHSCLSAGSSGCRAESAADRGRPA
jgi:EAL domain-containing protein (putative c-di-GMP-specific phosphodiesterase class I)